MKNKVQRGMLVCFFAVFGEVKGQYAIKYFPNPVTDKLTITNLKGQYESMHIYAVDGRHVLFKPIEFKNDVAIDVSQLPSGIYLIQLIQNNHSKIKSIKFIKSNN